MGDRYHRRQVSAERFSDMPLQNGELMNTYRRDFVERRSRENLSGFGADQEVDERVFEVVVKKPRGILKNSPTQSTPSSTPEGSFPSTSKPNIPQQYLPYEERQPFVSQSQSSYSPNYPIYNQPQFADQTRTYVSNSPYDFENPRFQQNVYKPTTESKIFFRAVNLIIGLASASTRTHKTYDKLAEVYSASGDTAQFASNLKSFMDDHIPGFVWVLLLGLQIMLGLLSIFVGTFNYPFCNAQPNIPVYLIVSGILLIMNGSIRLCTYIPTPQTVRSSSRNTLASDLCLYGFEGLILLGILVNVVLGCIWVYGSHWYIHFHDFGIFEERYCDWALYWFAWWSVTLHLLVGIVVIVVVLCILMYGSFAV